MLWLGAGGGTVHASSRLSGIAGQPDLTATYWAALAQASLGWGWPLGRGIPFAELRLSWQADGRSGPVRGSLQALTVQLGYRFDVL